MINKKLIIKSGILIVIFILFCSNYVLGFASVGVTSFYWEDMPLKLSPGETRDIEVFSLHNNIGDKNMTVKVDITKGSEIAKIIDSSNIYFVPFNSYSPIVNMRIAIPDTAKIGDTYPIELTFSNIEEGVSKGIGFKTSIKKGFPVNIVEKPKPPEELEAELARKKAIEEAVKKVAYIVMAVIVAILIIFLFTRKKVKIKKKK